MLSAFSCVLAMTPRESGISSLLIFLTGLGMSRLFWGNLLFSRLGWSIVGFYLSWLPLMLGVLLSGSYERLSSAAACGLSLGGLVAFFVVTPKMQIKFIDDCFVPRRSVYVEEAESEPASDDVTER
jgi:hypothetical protein